MENKEQEKQRFAIILKTDVIKAIVAVKLIIFSMFLI